VLGSVEESQGSEAKAVQDSCSNNPRGGLKVGPECIDPRVVKKANGPLIAASQLTTTMLLTMKSWCLPL
jgi:hypothetical protein